MSKPESDLSLILVHGAGSSATIWDPLIERLGGRWPVQAPNLPGHGGDPGPRRESIREYATWLEAYLSERVDGPAVLVGHSMGGAIALEVALRRRPELAGLVLVSTGARLRVAPEVLAGILADFEATMKRFGEYCFSPDTPLELRKESQVRLEQAGAETVHADLSACDRFDVMARLEAIELPTLVVCGAADQVTPAKYSHYLAQQIPGARLELIEGGSHMLPAEQPADLALLIAEFLEELGGGDRDDLDHYRV